MLRAPMAAISPFFSAANPVPGTEIWAMVESSNTPMEALVLIRHPFRKLLVLVLPVEAFQWCVIQGGFNSSAGPAPECSEKTVAAFGAKTKEILQLWFGQKSLTPRQPGFGPTADESQSVDHRRRSTFVEVRFE